jgi:hypothetical protein
MIFDPKASAYGGQVSQPEGSSIVGVVSVVGVTTAGKPAAAAMWFAGV